MSHTLNEEEIKVAVDMLGFNVPIYIHGQSGIEFALHIKERFLIRRRDTPEVHIEIGKEFTKMYIK